MEPRAKPVIFEIKALIFSGGYFMDKTYSFELLPKAIAYLTLILFLSGTRIRGIFYKKTKNALIFLSIII